MEIKLSETHSMIIEGKIAHIVDYSTDPPKIGTGHQFDVGHIDTKITALISDPNKVIIEYGNKVILASIVDDSITFTNQPHNK